MHATITARHRPCRCQHVSVDSSLRLPGQSSVRRATQQGQESELEQEDSSDIGLHAVSEVGLGPDFNVGGFAGSAFLRAAMSGSTEVRGQGSPRLCRRPALHWWQGWSLGAGNRSNSAYTRCGDKSRQAATVVEPCSNQAHAEFDLFPAPSVHLAIVAGQCERP